MVTPAYTVKRIGDRYELVRDDVVGKSFRAPWAVAGCAVALYGLGRRGLWGLLVAAAGADMICYGTTGNSYLHRIARHVLEPSADDPSRAPSYHHNQIHPSTQAPTDKVEEASMQSFPASDAPAHNNSVGQ